MYVSECLVYVYVFAARALQYYVILLHFRAHINSDVFSHSSPINPFVSLICICQSLILLYGWTFRLNSATSATLNIQRLTNCLQPSSPQFLELLGRKLELRQWSNIWQIVLITILISIWLIQQEFLKLSSYNIHNIWSDKWRAPHFTHVKLLTRLNVITFSISFSIMFCMSEN